MEAKRELEINILLLAKFITKRNKSYNGNGKRI